MELLIYLVLLLLLVVLCLVAELAGTRDRTDDALFDIGDEQREVMTDIAARRRRAEEHMRRVAFRGWSP
jgi:hypothetical protein